MQDFKTIFEQEYKKMANNSKNVNKPFDEVLKQYRNDIEPYLEYIASSLINKNLITYMEIGLCWGGSFVLTGNVLSQLGIQVNAIGVDLPNTPLWGGCGANLSIDIPKLDPKFKYNLVLGNSHRQKIKDEVINILHDAQVDLLLIDGDHSYHGCLHDFELYAPLVKIGGIIAFHDIVHYPKWKHVEVWKVWDRLKQHYEYREFASSEQNYGIGTIMWDGVYKEISGLR